MKATEIKSWKDLSDFVWVKVSGEDNKKLTAAEIDYLNKEVPSIVKSLGVDEIVPKAKKIMALNILNRKVSFKIFEQVPILWTVYYNHSIDTVAAETGQFITPFVDRENEETE